MLQKKKYHPERKEGRRERASGGGDAIRLFLADETIERLFQYGWETGAGKLPQNIGAKQSGKANPAAGLKTKRLPAKLHPEIIYEDKNVIFFNKPAGLLSQKAKPSDVSLVEYLTEHLLESEEATQESLRSFRPGICNRLDRNTSGLVAAGKSLSGTSGTE